MKFLEFCKTLLGLGAGASAGVIGLGAVSTLRITTLFNELLAKYVAMLLV